MIFDPEEKNGTYSQKWVKQGFNKNDQNKTPNFQNSILKAWKKANSLWLQILKYFVNMWLPSLCSSYVQNESSNLKINVVEWELHKEVGLGGLVCCFELPSWGPNLLEHQWELDFRIVELLGALPFAQLSWDGGSLNYLDAWMPHPMSRRHFGVHMLNCTVQSSISVFLVHIVIPSTTLIPQPNSIILNLGRILLKNLQSVQKLKPPCPLSNKTAIGS